jgi:hypothetical protein
MTECFSMARARLGAWVFVAAAFASVFGCSADDSPVDDFSMRAAAAICDKLGPCCAEAGFPFNAADCRQAMRVFVEHTLVERAIAAGATYDPQAGAECLDWLTEQARACDLRDELKPCERAFVGGKPTGAPCRRDFECARSTERDVTCTFGDVGSDLSCADKPHGSLGSACDTTCTDLIDGFECSGGGLTGSLANCWTNDGLYCAASGTCEPTVTIGEACSGLDCSEDAFCDESGICVPNSPDGAACTTNRECNERCAGGVCIRSRSDFIREVFCAAPTR